MTRALTCAPELQTERLILRGPERSDLDAYTTFVTTSPRLAAQDELAEADDAWGMFLAGIGHWQWHGYGFFVLVPRDGEQPVGRVGLLNHQGYDAVELAWHMFEAGEGHGFATEAAKRVRVWAARDLGLPRLVSYIDRGNQRSQAVARRLGATCTGRAPSHDTDADIWVHPEPEAA